MNALMLDSHEDYPHVIKPITYSIAFLFDAFQHHILYILSEDFSVGEGGPIVVAFIEVIPVHLVDSNCEHLLILLIDPILDDSVVDEFVDEHSCGVSKVEDQRVS